MYFKIFFAKTLTGTHLQLHISGKIPIKNVYKYLQTIKNLIEDTLIEAVFEIEYKFLEDIHMVID